MDDPFHEFPIQRGEAYSALDVELVLADPAGGLERVSQVLAASCLDSTARFNSQNDRFTVKVGRRSPAYLHGDRGLMLATTTIGERPNGPRSEP